MAQRGTRLINGIYHLGSILTKSGSITIATAHNRNTNDMVELILLDLPPTLSLPDAQHVLEPLEQRRLIKAAHTVQIFDWGIENQHAYIVSTPLHGVTLRYLMDNELIELPRALRLMQQILLGLQALHKHHITNLDLRPQFITVDTTDTDQTDYVQLDDPGLRELLRRAGYTQMTWGTNIDNIDPHYASPEHLQGAAIGPWSDVYQAGLLLFELVTGRLPFVGSDLNETARLQCYSPLPGIAMFVHNAPTALQLLLEKALAKQPTQRYADADAMLSALNRILPQPESQRLTGEIPHMPVESITQSGDIDTLLHARAIKVPLPPLPNAQGIYANLVYVRPDGKLQHIPLLKTDVLIGRSDPKHAYRPDIDLTIFDPKATVSRQHARISLHDGQFYLEDLGSKNKTRIANISLPPQQAIPLRPGDHLRFGSVQMDFMLPN